jgi:CheY-like chemotaxis protein
METINEKDKIRSMLMADFADRENKRDKRDERREWKEKKDQISENNLEENLGRLASDALKFRQVLLNIISNAIKFTDQGQIEIRSKGENDSITIEVEDTGIGIADTDIRNIFREFHQVENSLTREYGGTGLGLAICKKLITMLKGEIAVQSEPGKGSIFTIKIPRTLVGALKSEMKEAESPVSVKPVNLPGETRLTPDKKIPRILIVEDNADNMFSLKSLLEDDFEIIEAVDGVAALEKTFDHKPDLILLDISIPKIDGLQVAALLRKNEVTRQIRIIALTGHAMGGVAQEAKESGCDDYLTKPILYEDLIKCIKKWL